MVDADQTIHESFIRGRWDVKLKRAHSACSDAKRQRRRPARFAGTCEALELRLPLTGYVSFGEPIALPTGMNPEAITAADLDGDGLMDLVTADFADCTVTVHYGMGAGQFSESRYFFVGEGPADVIAGDLDGQHGLDLITANLLTGDVSVLLSSGSRRFHEETPYETGEFTAGVFLADLDGDGMLDLLAAVEGVENIGKISLLTGDPVLRATSCPRLRSWRSGEPIR